MFHASRGFSVLLGVLSDRAWYNIGLAVVLLVLALAFYWAYQMWKEVNEEVDPATTDELMASFDQARAAGELDDEEYAKIRKRIEQTGSAEPRTGIPNTDKARPKPPGPPDGLTGKTESPGPASKTSQIDKTLS
jgi:uncharacterized membrane protein